MKPDAWMPFYTGDYLRATLGLSLAEHGAYCLTIFKYWDKGCPLTEAEAARIVGPHRDVVAGFFQVTDGLWRHKRIEEELAKAKVISEKRSRAAMQMHSKCSANAVQMHTQSQSQSQSQLPSQPKSQTTAYAPSGAIQDFVMAWNGLGKPFAAVEKMGPARQKHLQARLRDSWWRENYAKAIAAMPGRPFLRGENDRGWIANVDWFLRPDTATKILEGQYSGGGKADSRPPWDAKPEDYQKLAEKALAERKAKEQADGHA